MTQLEVIFITERMFSGVDLQSAQEIYVMAVKFFRILNEIIWLFVIYWH